MEQTGEHKLPVTDSDGGSGRSCEDSIWLDWKSSKSKRNISPFLTVCSISKLVQNVYKKLQNLTWHHYCINHFLFSLFKMVWVRPKGRIPGFEVSSTVGPSALITFHISVLVPPRIDRLLTLPACSGLCWLAHLWPELTII